MTFLHPAWLLLILPAVVSLWIWRLPSRLLVLQRGFAFGLLCLALAGWSIRLPGQNGTVVVLVDRSLSMPAGAVSRQKEAVQLIDEARDFEDDLRVISFGQAVFLEPSFEGREFGGFVTDVGGDASDYSAALEQALSLIPRDAPGRMIILGDGRWTGANPADISAKAAARGIAIDYRLLERKITGDIAIEQVDAPSSAMPGESYMITAWVRSPVSQDVIYELKRGREQIQRGKRRLDAGLNRIVFRDRALEKGAQLYQLSVRGEGVDSTPENNYSRLFIGIDGPRPILHVAPDRASALGELLRKGELDVTTQVAGEVDWSLENLARYSALLFENVPANKIPLMALQNIAAWVRETGAGFMMTGGQTSFGPGGYYKSPLENLLPVSMELRQEHRKLAMAIVVAMDRSGSMMVPVAGGKTKMDLANLATVEVLDMLTSLDEFGVLAVDSSAHLISKLQPVTNKGAVREKVLRVQSMGGGIFVYEALQHAVNMLEKSELTTRHIILFSDAQDSEQPGAYRDLLDHCRKLDRPISVSVIGLGSDTDVDADFLRDIAKLGDGRIFFTTDAEELPKLFIQDTFVVARSTFIEEPTAVRATPGMISLIGKALEFQPRVGGYNLCYVRPGATLAAMTRDEYEAPIIAAWQVGSGRAMVYTGEADGKFTGDVAAWAETGHLFSSLARWTAGDNTRLPGNMLLEQEVEQGFLKVTLHLDPEREGDHFQELPKVRTLRGMLGQAPEVIRSKLRWLSADTLTVEIPLRGKESAITSIDVGEQTVALPPVTLPYSPEFLSRESGDGSLTLRRLAKASGGRERTVLSEIWRDLPEMPQLVNLSPWLLLAAVLLFLSEVFERRTGLLSTRSKIERMPVEKKSATAAKLENASRKPRKSAIQSAKARAKKRFSARVEQAPKPASRSSAEGSTVDDSEQESGPSSKSDMRDALKEARDQARRRLRR